MNISTAVVLKILLLSGIILSFYRWVSPMLLNPFRRWMTIPSLEARFPTRDVYAAVRLVAAAILQAAFFFALLWMFHPVIHISVRKDLNIATLLLASILGISEMAVVTLLGFSVMQGVALADRWAGRGSPNWSAVARGGWIQMYFKTIEVLPKPLGHLSVLLYIAFEECIFRVIVIGVIGPTSSLAGLAFSTGLFVYYQKFHTPGWRTAIFPMLGALIVGVVHGLLYNAVPNLFALVVAHSTFFASALWSMKSIDRSRAQSVGATYNGGRSHF
ncbi:type II CAAX prenyl endopeptidase Rce1 family protein [Tunturiibacter gelidoferens]|uniref:Uncharacterized protein n=1 Tax=Tunturiibacter gelidiferens TaxID=3069689 RepID=A0ACC5P557_9BACT|nr:CPBP family glutamic-type intramembrane protease [Edaphobacter lichenicola]MBB5342004.1 hypothetical protein [Edaphobacter lichenicola]